MNKLTLSDFLFSLNQDEDTLVRIQDYDSDTTIFPRTWKSGLLRNDMYDQYKNWLVIDFQVGSASYYNPCLIINISKEDPDND